MYRETRTQHQISRAAERLETTRRETLVKAIGRLTSAHQKDAAQILRDMLNGECEAQNDPR
jgi:hypothetical protein